MPDPHGAHTPPATTPSTRSTWATGSWDVGSRVTVPGPGRMRSARSAVQVASDRVAWAGQLPGQARARAEQAYGRTESTGRMAATPVSAAARVGDRGHLTAYAVRLRRATPVHRMCMAHDVHRGVRAQGSAHASGARAARAAPHDPRTARRLAETRPAGGRTCRSRPRSPPRWTAGPTGSAVRAAEGTSSSATRAR